MPMKSIMHENDDFRDVKKWVFESTPVRILTSS